MKSSLATHAGYIKTCSKITEFESSIDAIQEHLTISGDLAVFHTHRKQMGDKILLNKGIKLNLKEQHKYYQDN